MDQIERLLTSIKDPQEKENEKNKIIKSHEDYIAKMKHKQEAFFNKIGVDQSITVIGQSKKYNAKNFWSMSANDMAKFGITKLLSRRINDAESLKISYADIPPQGISAPLM